MKFRERAICIFKIFKNADDKSLRQIANEVSIPKSSVHRHKNNYQKRISVIGHDFFETPEGQDWLARLFFGTIFIFGIKAGVGSETIALFFKLIFVTVYAGSSVSSIRNIKNTMRTVIDEYGEQYTQEVINLCKNRQLHLGGDETFFGNDLFLVLMEVKSGFIFSEKLDTSRTYEAWWTCVGAILKRFKKIQSFTADGGQALKKLGEKIIGKNVMDLFHLLQDTKKLFATKFHSKRASLLSQLKKLKKQCDQSPAEKKENIQLEIAVNDKLILLNKGQTSYRSALFTVSTQSHPFKDNGNIKTSAELKTQLSDQLHILRNVAQKCEIDDKRNLLDRFEKRIGAFVPLNDLWHGWVEQSILCKTNDPEITTWIGKLLALTYWQEQFRKSKKKKRHREHYQVLCDQAKSQLENDPLTIIHLSEDWISFATALVLKYQRTTSAIEGRNAQLSQHYFSSRGIKSSHINPLTVIHNFWIKRFDNTTASERLCEFKPPDLFEFILSKMNHLPIPRQRERKAVPIFQNILPVAV